MLLFSSQILLFQDMQDLKIYLCFQWKPMYTGMYRGNDKFDSDYWKKTVFVKC